MARKGTNMANYKFKLLIKSEDIYKKLSLEQRRQFNDIKIINTQMLDNGDVHIECIALENKITDFPYIQHLITDGYIGFYET